MQHIKQLLETNNPDIIVDKVTKTAHGLSYLGAGGTVTSGLTHSEIGVYGGLVFTGLTYFTYLYFNWRKDRREEKAHLQKLKGKQ